MFFLFFERLVLNKETWSCRITNNRKQMCVFRIINYFIDFCKNKWYNLGKKQVNDPIINFLTNTLELHKQGKLIGTDLFTDLLWIVQKETNKNIENQSNEQETVENMMKDYILGWYINRFVPSHNKLN